MGTRTNFGTRYRNSGLEGGPIGLEGLLYAAKVAQTTRAAARRAGEKLPPGKPRRTDPPAFERTYPWGKGRDNRVLLDALLKYATSPIANICSRPKTNAVLQKAGLIDEEMGRFRITKAGREYIQAITNQRQSKET